MRPFAIFEVIESLDMELERYREVALKCDLPEYKLKAGDIATLIDFVPHPGDGEEGYILEVFNVVDESLAVVAVPSSQVEVLRSDKILTVRSFTKASEVKVA